MKRDFEALEQRRFEAIRLFEQEGLTQAEIARRLKVARQSVARWIGQYQQHGEAGLRQAGRAGRKPLLEAGDLKRLAQLLQRGPEALGYETPLWTCARVAHLIWDEFGVRYHAGHVWKVLVALGWSPQRPAGRARERNEEEIRRWKQQRWSATKKKARRQGRTIVFVDESGLSQQPHRCRTWASRGQTPVLEFNFNWQRLSAMAGITAWNFYFRLYPGGAGGGIG